MMALGRFCTEISAHGPYWTSGIIPKYGPRLVRIWYITNGCCLYNTCTASEVIITRKVLLENFLEVHEFTKLLEVYELLKNIPAWQNEIKKQNQKKASGSFVW